MTSIAKITLFDQEQIEYFVNGYVQAALFTQLANLIDDDNGEEYMDENYSGSDIECKSFNKIKEQCKDFMNLSHSLMDSCDLEQMGMDFFYVRHGHGVGFKDRDIDPKIADQLIEIAHIFRETYWFIQNEEIMVE